MKVITMVFALVLMLVACSVENTAEMKKKNSITATEQTEKEKITREFVEKYAKVGFSYDEVREVFGHEQYSGIIDHTMTFIYDSTTYKPFEYERASGSVAFDELKLEQLDYQLYINFMEETAVYYQYYFKGEDGEVWGYTVSELGENITRNSGN